MPKRQRSNKVDPKSSNQKKLNLRWDVDISNSESEGEQFDGESKSLINNYLHEDHETAETKRLRVAKELIKTVQEQISSDEDQYDGEYHDEVAKRLMRAENEASGRAIRYVSKRFNRFVFNPSEISYHRGHDLSVTCVALTPDDTTVFSGSKDNSVIRWDVETGKKVFILPTWRQQHKKSLTTTRTDEGEIYSVAVSSDGAFFATGGKDRLVKIWDARSNTLLHSFTGHRDAVSSLCFQTDTHSLYSASFDRTIRHWNIDDMGYVETLFGHQSEITDFDCFLRERAVSAAGDRTMRLWKITEDSQLVYKAKSTRNDAVSMVTETNFVSGGEDGSISFWHVGNKNPVCQVYSAHGSSNPWISSLQCIKGSDLLASGSSDGHLRLWKLNYKFQKINQISSIPIIGSINDIAISDSAKLLVAAVGQEHKYGRWFKVPNSKNGIYIVRLPTAETQEVKKPFRRITKTRKIR